MIPSVSACTVRDSIGIWNVPLLVSPSPRLPSSLYRTYSYDSEERLLGRVQTVRPELIHRRASAARALRAGRRADGARGSPRQVCRGGRGWTREWARRAGEEEGGAGVLGSSPDGAAEAPRGDRRASIEGGPGSLAGLSRSARPPPRQSEPPRAARAGAGPRTSPAPLPGRGGGGERGGPRDLGAALLYYTTTDQLVSRSVSNRLARRR